MHKFVTRDILSQNGVPYMLRFLILRTMLLLVFIMCQQKINELMNYKHPQYGYISVLNKYLNILYVKIKKLNTSEDT